MAKILQRYKNKIIIASGLLIGLAFVFPLMGIGKVADPLLVLATIIASVPIFYHAYQAIKLKLFSIELLVSIAVIGALIIGEYLESAVVTFLFLFGSFLESRTLAKTRASIQSLVDFAPEKATVIREDKEVIVRVEEVNQNDQIIVRAGGKVPVDGEVVQGEATINQATITGESMPVDKKSGDYVYSGTIVDIGFIKVKAEKVGEATAFAKIIELVEEAQDAKSKTERFLDRFAQYYTPGVMILSLIVYLIMHDVHLAVTFLVIACPGALVIGAPVSNVAGIGNGAKNGVLMKGGDAIDRFSKVKTFVFDKTGTLTLGKPEVTKIINRSEIDENEWLAQIAGIENASEHHIGRSVVQEAKNRNLKFDEPKEIVEIIKGQGVRAILDEKRWLIGNRQLLKDAEVEFDEDTHLLAQEEESKGQTVIFVACEKNMMGLIMIADKIRPEARDVIEQLKRSGSKKMIMLTGDNERTALAVADQLGIDKVYAELMPNDKLDHIKQFQANGERVVMVGDGINDAPALALADTGVAMGMSGTDVAIETADVVLMADQLDQLFHAFRLAKQTVRNRIQNITIALVTVFILLFGVLNQTIHLASGMFIHELSVLVVILNGMRLIRFKKERSLK